MKKGSLLSFRVEFSLFRKTRVCLLEESCFNSLTQTNIVKYDPSKYCHNLRKLEPDRAQAAPVPELTQHLEGRDVSANRKRQGEFSGMKKPPKKPRPLCSEALNGAAALSSGCQPRPKHTSSPQLSQRSNPKPNDELKLPPSRSLDRKTPGKGLSSDQRNVSGVTARNNTSVSDSDVDSEEEIRAMVKKETEKWKAGNAETESDPLEITGDDFGLKYSSHWSLSKPDAMKKTTKGSYKETVEYGNGYDSADTDEIIAEGKTPDPNSSKTAILEDSEQMKVESKKILANKKSGLLNDSSLKTQNVEGEHIEKKWKIKKSKIGALQTSAVTSTAETSDSESSHSESEQGESEISSDYESVMQNCYRLDLSLHDLKALAAKNTGTPAEESDGAQSSAQSPAEENPKGNANKPKLPKCHPADKKKSISPDDVLADILAGENKESSKGQNNSRLKYQPFRGMESLCVKESTKDSTGLKKGSVGLGLGACVFSSGEESSKRQPKNHPLCALQVSSKKRQNVPSEQHEAPSPGASSADERHQPVSRPCLQGKKKDRSSPQDHSSEHGAASPSPDQSDSESSDRDSNAAGALKHVKRQRESPKLLSKKMKMNVSNKKPECEANTCENRKTSLLEDKELCLHAAASKEPTRDKQEQDNQRRLAALEERHRERELQKKLIQGALSNLDSQPAGKHKHILFDSDTENETLKKDASLGNMPGEDTSAPKPSGKLFDSSEDEEDNTDNERFIIKPQFEGKAGEKLLRLQSRFGTDERFRMDARFLESDSEEEETLMPSVTIPPDRTTQFLKGNQVLQKRRGNITACKAKRKKKKKEESEKLPQVSEEVYYDIAADLKDLFGSSKSQSEKREGIPWDKDDAEDSAPPDYLEPVSGNNTAQEPSGFKFSFFGDTEKSGVKEEPYILETIKPGKVTWQEDPRFQDSSSEDDDEPEASEIEKDQEMQVVFVFYLVVVICCCFFACHKEKVQDFSSSPKMMND
ncbi:nucleolar protein 8-like [Pithys albifrons albifrons]|uniref:nucleolar protein 8-like n=1 Tax=Pithys albifrons albifrons TaxID=3385563 RepID=UPI003A5CDFF6